MITTSPDEAKNIYRRLFADSDEVLRASLDLRPSTYYNYSSTLTKAGLAAVIKQDGKNIGLRTTEEGKQLRGQGGAAPVNTGAAGGQPSGGGFSVVTLQAINEQVKVWNRQNKDFPYKLVPEAEGVPMGK